MNSIFKANDVRGVYPLEINEEIVSRIGIVIAGNFLKAKRSHLWRGSPGKAAKLKPVLIIGHDARLSSPSLYRALINGIRNHESRIRVRDKADIHNSRFIIHDVGSMTTPMLYFLVAHSKADGGIMVTASHNPKEYNGLKVVGKNAEPISGLEIRKLVEKFSQ